MDPENIFFGIVVCGTTIGIPFPRSFNFAAMSLIQTDRRGIRGVLILIINILLTPFLLLGHSCRMFLFPCFSVIVGKCVCHLVFLFKCCADYFLFTDHQFPPLRRSLGKIESKTDLSTVEWVRIQDLKIDNVPKVNCLFDDIRPEDICQGALGDCWLLAALATLSENPAIIQNCFLSRSFNPAGKYSLRLFNTESKAFETIVVDDYVPCKSGSPIFTKIKGNYMWPLLLEKAFAKQSGSYAAIEGGDPLNAMKAISGWEGDHIFAPFDDTIFRKLSDLCSRGCLLAAGSRGKDTTLTTGRGSGGSSIVPGHAYSILNIKTPMLTTSTVRLLKLRNPWGSFEWTGDWSDASNLWSTHPGVALEIGRDRGAKEDGVFYIGWEDFVQRFNYISVLYPDGSLESLHIDVHEQYRTCGAVAGCVFGCTKFWCCCRGCYSLWFAESSADMKNRVRVRPARDPQ